MDFYNAFYNAAKPLSYLRQITINELIGKVHKEMKEYLEKHKNKLIAKVPYYESFTDFGWEYNNENEVPQYIYEHVPAGIIEDLEKLLRKDGLQDHVGEIASILQTWYCRKLLFDSDKGQIDNNKKFDEQFKALYEILGEELLEIKIIARQSSVSIKNDGLINLIRQSFVESVLKLPTVVEHLNNIEQSGAYEDKPGEQIKQGAALNILIYLQTQTVYKFNAPKPEALNSTFSNKQLLLIYKLMVTARIVDNKELIDSDSSNLIRNYIKRSIHKQPNLQNLFENSRTKSVTQFTHVDDERVLKLFAEGRQSDDDRIAAIKNNIENISSIE